MLPQAVLEKAASEMLDYNGTGQSVMEMSHRSKAYKPIIQKAEALVRELMSIPDNYKVLFLQGGASLQFAMIPMNLAKKGKAAYIDTGTWSVKAIKEAKKYLTVDVIASSKEDKYTYIPKVDKVTGDYDYVHITLNNTIVGTKWNTLPDTGDIPLIADASSNILSEPLDVSKFGIIYAGAQKNLGPAELHWLSSGMISSGPPTPPTATSPPWYPPCSGTTLMQEKVPCTIPRPVIPYT